ncbi:hypothetical protein [Anaeromyxobacter diazotrophicus]|uniref:Uncharacterized protein n=1 Tax=Anaeromyxobacter diazotrophicus TaxID=2590199 RepID=A0A7I9VSG9_9BACT|nr:hypothetical protein [Anaeromyxobacter diazotrophicus]GEJ59396.1 hypothetical protein AMYX_41370 [Anaeromyxobacter diazotrophicus]
MSASAALRASKHRCSCSRRATYRVRARRGRHASTDHPLCQRCWRSLVDRYRVRTPAVHRWLEDELLARVLVRAAAPS